MKWSISLTSIAGQLLYQAHVAVQHIARVYRAAVYPVMEERPAGEDEWAAYQRHCAELKARRRKSHAAIRDIEAQQRAVVNEALRGDR